MEISFGQKGRELGNMIGMMTGSEAPFARVVSIVGTGGCMEAGITEVTMEGSPEREAEVTMEGSPERGNRSDRKVHRKGNHAVPIS